MIPLAKLGNRICIIGCSSSGKSTLAAQLAKKLNIPCYHLDTMAHYPHSAWQRRPDQELVALHDDVLQEERWIMDGNYSVCMRERFAHATSVIWLDPHPGGAAFRYLVRSFKGDPKRVGHLPGAGHEFRLRLLKHILCTYPQNRAHYQALIHQYFLPCVHIQSMAVLKQYYQYWELPEWR